MITTEAVALTLGIVKGVIRLSKETDAILAEK